MNLLVYLGLLNYCIALALALFLSGFWIRYWLQLRVRHMTTLLVCLIFMLLTHPVPVAVFLLFIGVHFGVDLARSAAAGPRRLVSCLRDRRRPLAMIAAFSGMSVAWVSMFLNNHPQQANYLAMGWIDKVIFALKLSGIAPFRSPLYRLSLAFLLLFAGLACVACVWKRRGHLSSSAIALIAISAICFTLFCFAPYSINGAYYFSNRFAVFGIMFLVAAAAALRPPPRWSLAAGLIGLSVTVALLPLQWVTVSRIANEIRPGLDAPTAEAGSAGIIIGESRAEGGGERRYAPDLYFDPFMWSGAHYFRRSKAILENTPWMDLPIIMVQPLHVDRWSYLSPDAATSSLLTALDDGDAVPKLSLLVLEGPSDVKMEEIITRSHGVPLTQSNGEIRIFALHP